VDTQSHVLVVEDDVLVAEVVIETLDPPYATTHVEDCAAALLRLRAGGIDVVLLDCTLPGGIDPELLSEADACGVPIVLMSGHPETAERIAGGRRPYLVKPFSMNACWRRSRKCCRRRRAASRRSISPA